jgi:lipopolysaccharide transport system ATP-binding protein
MSQIQLDKVSLDFPLFVKQTHALDKRDSNKSARRFRALEDVSLDLNDGDRLAIIGSNGSGKTTLLRLLAGVYQPTNGKLSIEGSIGSLIEINLGIDMESTGRESLFVRAALMGMSRKEASSIVEVVREFSELGDFFDLPVRLYSSGMQFRLAFAISSLISRDILLMDEWLSVGDEAFREKSERKLESLVSSSKILVIATHSLELAKRLCNRAIWLEGGRVVEDGYPGEVIEKYAHSVQLD